MKKSLFLTMLFVVSMFVFGISLVAVTIVVAQSPPPPPPAPGGTFTGLTGVLTVSTNIVTGITDTSASVSWSLSAPATGQVEYGLTTSYGSLTTKEFDLLSAHSQKISNLTPGATYFYRINSTDQNGNTVLETGSFTTTNTSGGSSSSSSGGSSGSTSSGSSSTSGSGGSGSSSSSGGGSSSSSSGGGSSNSSSGSSGGSGGSGGSSGGGSSSGGSSGSSSGSSSSGGGGGSTTSGTSRLAIDARIVTTDTLSVRSGAGTVFSKEGRQPRGAFGVVKDGPRSANGYWWWKVNYDSGPDGWSAGNWLKAVSSSNGGSGSTGSSGGSSGGGGSSSGGSASNNNSIGSALQRKGCYHAYHKDSQASKDYATPYNRFSSARELLVEINCNNDVLVVSAGKPGAIVYNQGYVYSDGSWQSIRFAGVPHSGDWLSGKAVAILPFRRSGVGTDYRYILAHVCVAHNNAWRCGCSDDNCTSRKWHIQAIRR